MTFKLTHVTFPIRWFTVNVSSVNFFRNALQVTNQGPNPPAVLYLSDGGHIENLGILPLLKLRLPKIVCVEGGRTISDEDYAGCLLRALDMARIKLRCSFTGMDGQDITEDIRDKFVERGPGSQPRSYRSVTSDNDFLLLSDSDRYLHNVTFQSLKSQSKHREEKENLMAAILKVLISISSVLKALTFC